MITAVRPNIQAYQAKAQIFRQRMVAGTGICLHPEVEQKILAGDPASILELGRRYSGHSNNAELKTVLDGMKERNPKNHVVKALSEYIDNWIETIKPKPVHQGGGMRK